MGIVDGTCSYSSQMIMVAGLFVIIIGALFMAVIELEKQLNDNITEDSRKKTEKDIESCRYAGNSMILFVGVFICIWTACSMRK